MTFVAYTGTAVLGGWIFLLGAPLPVESATLDGVSIQPFLLEDNPDARGPVEISYTAVLDVPAHAKVGRHRLVVTFIGDEVWRQDIQLLAAPLPRLEEVGGSCQAPIRCAGYVEFLYGASVSRKVLAVDGRVTPSAQPPAPIGNILWNDGQPRAVAGEWYDAHTPPQGWGIQAIYPDGTIGDQWLLDCEKWATVPMPGDATAPLWLRPAVLGEHASVPKPAPPVPADAATQPPNP